MNENDTIPMLEQNPQTIEKVIRCFLKKLVGYYWTSNWI